MLLKYTPDGTLSWAETAGGAGYDYASAVIQTTGGNYLLAGASNSYDADSVVFLLEYLPDGTPSWAGRLPGMPGSEAQSITQSVDGGFVIAGFSEYLSAGSNDAMLLKYAADWTNTWAMVVGGSAEDRAYAVAQSDDNGFILAGYTQSAGAGSADSLLLKIASNGVFSWAKAVGGSSSDWAWAVTQVAGGDYTVAGSTSSYGAGDYDVLLLNYAENGAPNWARTIGGESADRGKAFVKAVDGGYILAGRTDSFGAGFSDALVISTDANGFIKACPLCQLVYPTTTVFTPAINYVSSNAYLINTAITNNSPSPNTTSPALDTIIICDGYYHAYLPLIVR
jgi:hypothetical protein